MGKLHKIRRAFDRLTHEQKINMGLWPGEYGCVYWDGYWQFHQWEPSYRQYVKKLINQYCRKEEIDNRHVFERAYLNGEQWAIDEFDRLYR